MNFTEKTKLIYFTCLHFSSFLMAAIIAGYLTGNLAGAPLASEGQKTYDEVASITSNIDQNLARGGY